MSNPSQRMRKNISPKQGPIRATVPLSLMHQTCSPTKCLIGSPSKSPPSGDGNRTKITRLSPDNRTSPETHSTCRADVHQSKCPYIRRTASVDTLYLLGQWQRDALYLSYCGRLMMDRATQTPDEFEEPDRKPTQKRCGSTCSETLEMKLIRQRLQRSGPRLRQSPLPPDQHQPPSTSSPHHSSSSIPIPDIPKTLTPRMRSSVEGLNQRRDPTPEGHRAPIADLFSRRTHSVDTQTPFDYSDNSSTSGSPSASPAAVTHGLSRPSSSDENKSSPDADLTHKLATSPHINKFLTREPPDGCEKVKIAEETRSSFCAARVSCPKPSMNFVLLPSRRSAFYPLCKMTASNGTELLNADTTTGHF